VSAPKTPEGRAAALAKSRETTRKRPIVELRDELERFSKRFRYAGDAYREDLYWVGCVIDFASHFVTERPADEEATEALKRAARGLLDLKVAERQKAKRQRVERKEVTTGAIDFATAAARVRTRRSEERRQS
jgi:hypothetical protein